MIWQDRELVNSKKILLKDMTTGTIKEYEIQDDADNVIIEGTPILSSALNDIENKLVIANQTESEEGIDNIKKMTPLKTKQAIDYSRRLDGWNLLEATFTLSTYDSTVKQAIVTTSIDLTEVIELGDRLKYTNDGTIKYAIVHGKSATTLTLFLGTDYAIAGTGTITNVYYSHMSIPLGFQRNLDKWSIGLVSITTVSQQNPNVNQYYNVGSISLPIGAGLWNVSYFVDLFVTSGNSSNTDTVIGLSTSPTAETNQKSESCIAVNGVTGALLSLTKTFLIELSAKTPHYLIAKANASNVTNIYYMGNRGGIIIKAVSAYL
jgi:hypothetical protein